MWCGLGRGSEPRPLSLAAQDTPSQLSLVHNSVRVRHWRFQQDRGGPGRSGGAVWWGGVQTEPPPGSYYCNVVDRAGAGAGWGGFSVQGSNCCFVCYQDSVLLLVCLTALLVATSRARPALARDVGCKLFDADALPGVEQVVHVPERLLAGRRGRLGGHSRLLAHNSVLGVILAGRRGV